jgi:hypothetical protein
LFRRQGVKLTGDWQSKIPRNLCGQTPWVALALATGGGNVISFPELEPFLFTAGLVKFFSAAQIATRFFPPSFCKIYFITVFVQQNRPFHESVSAWHRHCLRRRNATADWHEPVRGAIT